MAMTFVKEISRCFCIVCQNSFILRNENMSPDNFLMIRSFGLIILFDTVQY